MITFRNKTSIGDVTVPVILRIKHGVEAQVSTSPLEDGADITDHVRVAPQGVEVVGIVVPTDQSVSTIGALAGVLGAPTELDVEAWLSLKAMILSRKRIEIVTRYQTYYVLPISLLADEDAGFGMALQFSMRFIEIEQGSVSSIDQIALELQDTIGGKTGTDNLGGQQLGPEEDVPVGKGKSKPIVVNPWTQAYETGGAF